MCAVKERFVEKPNLPESKVTTAAVSGAYPEILEAAWYSVRHNGV